VSEVLLAFAFFLALHSIPALPAVRANLVGLVGHRAYISLYSIASVIALAWLFHAALQLDYVEIWAPAPWQAWVTLVLAPIGIFLVLAGLFSANPFSISFRKTRDNADAIVGVTRHPVLWGFLFWSLAHLAPNGDLRALILFGGLALFSALGFLMLERRARKRWGGRWEVLSSRSSVLPFAAILGGRAPLRLDAPIAAAVLLTVLITAWLLLGGHAVLFGADPLLLV
jgi:uncharacterized membrane protein